MQILVFARGSGHHARFCLAHTRLVLIICYIVLLVPRLNKSFYSKPLKHTCILRRLLPAIVAAEWHGMETKPDKPKCRNETSIVVVSAAYLDCEISRQSQHGGLCREIQDGSEVFPCFSLTNFSLAASAFMPCRRNRLRLTRKESGSPPMLERVCGMASLNLITLWSEKWLDYAADQPCHPRRVLSSSRERIVEPCWSYA